MGGEQEDKLKILFTWPKFSAKITLSLVIPFSFIFVANVGLSFLLTSKITHNQATLDRTQHGTAAYNALSSVISGEWTAYWLIKAAYFTSLLVFSLLSTSAVVYLVASINTAEDITFMNILISVVPKVWRAIWRTFLLSFGLVILFNALAVIVFVVLAMIGGGPVGKLVVVAIAKLMPFLTEFVLITVMWQLLSVVSEDRKGAKSKGQVMFEFVVASSSSEYTILQGRIGLGILSLAALSFVFFVSQTWIIYLGICRSYHHKNVDRCSLGDHLEAYLGVYVPPTAENSRLEQV